MNNNDQSISGVNRDINPISKQYPTGGIGKVRMMLAVGILIFSLVLSACSSSASNTTPTSVPPVAIVQQNSGIPTQTSKPLATPTLAIAPKATNVPLQAAIKTQLDPCELINSQEASTLVGTTYGEGKETTTHDNLKICTYGGQSTNILTVEVVQAPDVATAQADKAQFLTDLQSNMKDLTDQGLNVTQLPNFADGAVAANANVSGGGVSLSGNAFGFLKGTVFFGFSDLAIGGTAPTDAAMQAEAKTVLGKLP